MNGKIKIYLSAAIFFSVFFNFTLNSALAGNLLSVQLMPNDPDFTEQYYLKQVRAVGAWDKTTESPEVVVAVIDTGVDIYHPDLADNIWINNDEIRGDGLDNDNNGYVDDYQGWDFILNSADPRPKFGGETSSLGVNHGTIVAGLIGAVGNNNLGIAGLNWKIKIMPLRALNNQGSGDVETVVAAVKYAIANGADIINLSIVGNFSDINLENAIEKAYQSGLMIMAAAGNESSPDEVGDLGVAPKYPICYDGGDNYVFGVGSVGFDDVISSFSNYGACIDIMAPGEYFYSTLVYEPVFPDYRELFGGYWSGTSVATPLVAGTAAMIKGLRPELANYEIYNIIKAGADPIDQANPKFAGKLGGGRLNINNALNAAQNFISDFTGLIAAPAGNHSPLVQIISQSGSVHSQFFAYNEMFKGGFSLASADINQDGVKEIITAAGQGGGPHIRIFNHQGDVLKQFFAYDTNFTGGVNVAAADLDADGQVEIITAPMSGYRSLVKIFDVDGNLKKSQAVFSNNYLGGVNLALSDINADGKFEIVVSRNDNNSTVKIFNSDFTERLSFTAFEENTNSGVQLAAADLYGDSRTEIIVSAGNNSKIRIFSPAGNLENEWPAYDINQKIGVNLFAGDFNQDGKAEIVASPVAGLSSPIKVFNSSGRLLNQFFIYEDGFLGGINVSF